MEETVEKIYCCDRDNNDNALTAAILANGNNRRDDWGPMAAMMGGGMNNWMNNPFAYLMFLALQNCCCQTQRQIADFRADIQLQNCKDTAEIRNGQRDLGFAITQGFSSTAFQAQQDKFELSQERQNNLINERFNRLGNCGCGC